MVCITSHGDARAPRFRSPFLASATLFVRDLRSSMPSTRFWNRGTKRPTMTSGTILFSVIIFVIFVNLKQFIPHLGKNRGFVIYIFVFVTFLIPSCLEIVRIVLPLFTFILCSFTGSLS